MFRLDGKIALVTGGSRGIGRACCEALAEQGATVVVNYVKGEAAAREVADGIVAKGGKAETAGFDVANTAATEAAIDGIIKKHGKLDVLVANAGIAIDGLLLRLKDEDLQRLFGTNVRGAVTCARVAIKSMMRSKNGRIVFMSSVIGEMGNVGQTGYAITKAALLGATKSIAREYASRNVTVNAITPGFIDTGNDSVDERGDEVFDLEGDPARPHGLRARHRDRLRVSRERRIRLRHRTGPSGQRWHVRLS